MNYTLIPHFLTELTCEYEMHTHLFRGRTSPPGQPKNLFEKTENELLLNTLYPN